MELRPTIRLAMFCGDIFPYISLRKAGRYLQSIASWNGHRMEGGKVPGSAPACIPVSATSTVASSGSFLRLEVPCNCPIYLREKVWEKKEKHAYIYIYVKKTPDIPVKVVKRIKGRFWMVLGSTNNIEQHFLETPSMVVHCLPPPGSLQSFAAALRTSAKVAGFGPEGLPRCGKPTGNPQGVGYTKEAGVKITWSIWTHLLLFGGLNPSEKY